MQRSSHTDLPLQEKAPDAIRRYPDSQKAPIPVTRIEQSTANKATIKGSPFEVELKMNSVQM